MLGRQKEHKKDKKKQEASSSPRFEEAAPSFAAEDTCVICLDEKSDHIILDCMHMCLCEVQLLASVPLTYPLKSVFNLFAGMRADVYRHGINVPQVSNAGQQNQKGIQMSLVSEIERPGQQMPLRLQPAMRRLVFL